MIPALTAETVEVTDAEPLLSSLPGPDAYSWVLDGEGVVGWGEAARLEVSGADRFERAADWWSQTVGRSTGEGLLCFASFAFSDGHTPSVLVVPQALLTRRDGRSWLTRITRPGQPTTEPAPAPVTPPGRVTYAEGRTSLAAWRGAIGWARNAIAQGDLDKIVLALDVVAQAERDIDARWLLQGLAEKYPSCWAFSVDGLVGATPELLVRRRGDLAESRVLAGTVRRTDAAADRALLESGKDRREHRYAVDSLVAGFTAHCKDVRAGDPYLLELKNVVHIATDVRARVTDAASVLELAGSLHPTAAVGGTPTRAALRAISRVERSDRGRYAAPVGWVDATGDGELGLALRCAQLDGPQARLWAGCGIVGDSDPDAETAEVQAKLDPVRTALSRD